MMEIALTQGKTALVDDEDYAFLSGWRWHAWTTDRRHRIYYAARVGADRKPILMHQVVIQRSGLSGLADHKDGNGLNNTRGNLRPCTKAQNTAAADFSPGISGFRGVSPSRKKWRALIKKDGHQIWLGSFKTKEEAARAYDKAAADLWGDFAWFNFPDEHAVSGRQRTSYLKECSS